MRRIGLILFLVGINAGIFLSLLTVNGVQAKGGNKGLPQITLTTTVGTTPSTCATTDTTSITSGGVVSYCYTVHNHSNMILTQHTISDTMFGQVAGFKFPLMPNSTTSLIVTQTILADTASVATWRASKGVQVATGSDGVAVFVEEPTAVTLTHFSDGQHGQTWAWVLLVLLFFGVQLQWKNRRKLITL